MSVLEEIEKLDREEHERAAAQKRKELARQDKLRRKQLADKEKAAKEDVIRAEDDRRAELEEKLEVEVCTQRMMEQVRVVEAELESLRRKKLDGQYRQVITLYTDNCIALIWGYFSEPTLHYSGRDAYISFKKGLWHDELERDCKFIIVTFEIRPMHIRVNEKMIVEYQWIADERIIDKTLAHAFKHPAGSCYSKRQLRAREKELQAIQLASAIAAQELRNTPSHGDGALK
jgi:hypothetical protein